MDKSHSSFDYSTFRKELESLTAEEVRDSTSLTHDVCWYGFESAVHVFLMNKAKNVVSGRLSPDKFVSRYGLGNFLGDEGVVPGSRGFNCLVRKLPAVDKGGIFVPTKNLSRNDKMVSLFSDDYLNIFVYGGHNELLGDKSVENAKYLCSRHWSRRDLADSELVSRGLRFGFDMLRVSANNFENYEPRPGKNPQPAKATEIGRKIMNHYLRNFSP